MTAIAVISDSMLHPFYPQYFAEVFGVHSARTVGIYIASCSLTVLSTFPLWAQLARRVPVIPLLVATQIGTAVLSLACSRITWLPGFWAVSLVMMVGKASYLLIYPYVMTLQPKEKHLGTISLLALVVYFGNVLAAALAGSIFQWLSPSALFVGMAVGDLLQIGLCLWMLRAGAIAAAAATARSADSERSSLSRGFVLRLGAVMFVLYFSAYLPDPFFSSFWEARVASSSRFVSGLVFALPALAALGALGYEKLRGDRGGAYGGIIAATIIGMCALWLQASGISYLLLAGRFLFGWALFQAMVRLDLLLFRHSHPDTYAVDFSKVNLFQGLGVLVASLSAGTLVSTFGMRVPFIVAACGFFVGVSLYVWLFRRELRAAGDEAEIEVDSDAEPEQLAASPGAV
jgi:MFS transporter, DHA1 family, multidrug resistance protein